MKKTLCSISLALISAVMMTSCLDTKETKQELRLDYSGESCFNRVVDRQTGDVLINVNPSYEMKYNMTGTELDFSMSNIQLAAGFSGLSFKLPTLKYDVEKDSYYYLTKATDVVPQGAAGSYIFSDFTLRSIPQRYVDGVLCPVYQINYTVNSRYEVTVYPTNPVLVGTMNSTQTDKESRPVHTTTNSPVSIIVDPVTKTARISIVSAEVGPTEGKATLIFKEVPVEITAYGYSIATPEDTEYQIYNTNNAAMNACKYSNLKLTFVLATGRAALSCDLDMTSRTNQDVDWGKYHVEMDLGYFFKVDNN